MPPCLSCHSSSPWYVMSQYLAPHGMLGHSSSPLSCHNSSPYTTVVHQCLSNSPWFVTVAPIFFYVTVVPHGMSCHSI